MPSVKPDVLLLSYTPNPIQSLYMAYRVCYSPLTPREIYDKIQSGTISQARMATFVKERLETGHSSPLQQVHFEFGISGVSRAFSHQFVRHHVGISFEQQSQRYVDIGQDFDYVCPPAIEENGLFKIMMQEAGSVYKDYNTLGAETEDARFVLPNATATNLKITVNLAALRHIASLRLCTRAQWEFRKVVSLMRAEVAGVCPELSGLLGIKCQAMNLGYCDESKKDWLACPVGAVRPHKSQVLELKGWGSDNA